MASIVCHSLPPIIAALKNQAFFFDLCAGISRGKWLWHRFFFTPNAEDNMDNNHVQCLG